MGVGDPASLVEAVALGVDQFDCVMQTRLGRHGTALTVDGQAPRQGGPPRPRATSRSTPTCACEVCARHSRGLPPPPVPGRRADGVAPGQPAQRGLDAAADGADAGRDRRRHVRRAARARCWPSGDDAGAVSRPVAVGFSRRPGRPARAGIGTEPMHVLAILAAEDDGGGGAGGLVQLGILLLIPLAMYFLMIRPQRRRMREQQAMQSVARGRRRGDDRRPASTASSPASRTTSSGWRSTTTCRSASPAASLQGKVDATERRRRSVTPTAPQADRAGTARPRSRASTADTASEATDADAADARRRNEPPPPLGVAARLPRRHVRPARHQPRPRQHARARARPAGRRVGRPRPRGGRQRRRPARHPRPDPRRAREPRHRRARRPRRGLEHHRRPARREGPARRARRRRRRRHRRRCARCSSASARRAEGTRLDRARLDASPARRPTGSTRRPARRRRHDVPASTPATAPDAAATPVAPAGFGRRRRAAPAYARRDDPTPPTDAAADRTGRRPPTIGAGRRRAGDRRCRRPATTVPAATPETDGAAHASTAASASSARPAAPARVFSRDSAERRARPSSRAGPSSSASARRGEAAWNALAAAVLQRRSRRARARQLAIVLDDVIQSAPTVNEPSFSGNGVDLRRRSPRARPARWPGCSTAAPSRPRSRCAASRPCRRRSARTRCGRRSSPAWSASPCSLAAAGRLLPPPRRCSSPPA